jgi:UDP-glucose 4-epimerase
MNSEIAKNDTFNIGNDTIVTILELAQTIIELTGSSSKIVHLPPLPEGDMTRRQPDITKMKTLLNRELTPFREGIQRILVEKYGF